MGLLTGLRHGYLAHRCFRGILAWRRGLLDGLWHDHPAHRCLSGIPAWQRGTSDRPLARPPCPQVPQGHPGVAKDEYCPVFGTATMPTGAPEASRRGEEPPDQRQTGLCSMQRPVILLSGLPPDLPDGFIRQPYRPSDRPALPTALPEALAAGSHGSSLPPTLPAGFVSQTFRPPDRQTFPNARPTASPPARPPRFPNARPPVRPACLTDSLT